MKDRDARESAKRRSGHGPGIWGKQRQNDESLDDDLLRAGNVPQYESSEASWTNLGRAPTVTALPDRASLSKSLPAQWPVPPADVPPVETILP